MGYGHKDRSLRCHVVPRVMNPRHESTGEEEYTFFWGGVSKDSPEGLRGAVEISEGFSNQRSERVQSS